MSPLALEKQSHKYDEHKCENNIYFILFLGTPYLLLYSGNYSVIIQETSSPVNIIIKYKLYKVL